MNYHYTDKNWCPLYGDAAKQAVEKCNDAAFLDKEFGIISVSKERWYATQEAEKNGWMNLWLSANQDRNDEHFILFDRYRSLQGRVFDHAIELGCGPFTNLKWLGGAACQIRQCTLLDPLIESYLTHPNCTYDRAQLQCINHISLPVANSSVSHRRIPSFSTIRSSGND